ncbi:ATP-binding protein [Treponema endosymbiont of Eucomonympha sp.]|uniref:ATP-binding protein n=1 Tax=Treponema endosymbiont of Eucomonympha sp. TaxID=1580831 RepID=UPI000783FCEA|nr:ATP-binding protein [Treponema endosymbiont of Eucomonympha sp.]
MDDFTLCSISTTQESYQKLIDLHHALSQCLFDDVHIALETWFSANMSAALGGILDQAAALNAITVDSPNKQIISILQKNGFLANYGYQKTYDTYHTAIPYLKLKLQESRYFHNYVLTELLMQKDLPPMTDLLKKKIAESIHEIFVNAQIHSGTDYIYTCGQFFPTKGKIEFAIVDMGIGFKKKINDRFSTTATSVQAIKWALQDGHTTKKDIPGGIGLAILQEFIKLNGGKLQIVSDDGFYQVDNEGETLKVFTAPFPGTIINMQFRTDDDHSYCLSNEAKHNSIF